MGFLRGSEYAKTGACASRFDIDEGHAVEGFEDGEQVFKMGDAIHLGLPGGALFRGDHIPCVADCAGACELERVHAGEQVVQVIALGFSLCFRISEAAALCPLLDDTIETVHQAGPALAAGADHGLQTAGQRLTQAGRLAQIAHGAAALHVG